MPLTAEYRLTPDVAARAVDEFLAARWRFLFRSTATPLGLFVLYTAACGACYGLFRVLDADPWAYTALLVFAALGGAGVVMLLGLILVASVALANARRRCERTMPLDHSAGTPPLVRWTFDDAGFRTELEGTTREVTWDRVRLFLVTPNFWLVGIKRGPDLLLPREVIPDGLPALVRKKLPNLYAQATASSGSGTG